MCCANKERNVEDVAAAAARDPIDMMKGDYTFEWQEPLSSS